MCVSRTVVTLLVVTVQDIFETKGRFTEGGLHGENSSSSGRSGHSFLFHSLWNAVLTPVFHCLVGILYFVVSSGRPRANDLEFASYERLKHKHWW